MQMGATGFRLTVVTALAALATCGCRGGSHDRAGGAIAPKAAVLTLTTHDSGTGVRDWADAVQRHSHGSVRIVVQSTQEPTEAEYVKRAIADVRDGRVSLASVPVRGYDALGARGLDGLLAPFLIDSYALQRRVLASDLPTRVLPAVQRLGVVGIAVLPGPLQKLLSIGGPMLAPSDYRNQEIGVHPSTEEAGLFRALGTTSTELEPGGDISQLRGIEADLVELVANRYNLFTADETLASNVSFWPRVGSIVMNDKALAALSRTQREALRRAGRAALDPALARLERDEHTALLAICPAAPEPPGSFHFLSATPRDLAALRTAAAPVYRRLEQSDATRGVIAAIEAMKTGVTRPPAPACPGASSRHPGAQVAGGAMRLTAELARTGKTTWTGAVTSQPLGRGRLELRVKGGLTFGGRWARSTRFEAQFARGTLRGCIDLAVVPGPGGDYRWIGGPGAVKTASRGLRRYAGVSLRFAGTTGANDLGHVGGRFVTDAPTGLPC
jgi:TRAP-type C4-dicarboxylate transport system substrate-binding protein